MCLYWSRANFYTRYTITKPAKEPIGGEQLLADDKDSGLCRAGYNSPHKPHYYI